MINWIQKNKIGLSALCLIVLTTFLLVLSLSAQNQLTTRPDDVLLRQAPSRTAKQIQSLKSGTKLTVLKRQNGWWYVKDAKDNQEGWVASWVANNTFLKKPTPLSEATIVLDPGHGGSDTGAMSYKNKNYEKTYTLETARATKKELEKTGARVLMTRDSDVVVPLLYIPRTAEKYRADAQISFHFDASGSHNSASGISQYYYNDNSLDLVQTLSQSLNNLPLQNRGFESIPYLVIKDVTRPAVLLELGFIDSDKDLSYIKSAAYQKKAATDIKNGLLDYIKTH
ncbi:N-acetylmuramoyl-L-alanine amidase [Fructobacillus sp. M1-13]|uniref:N-acetylmuramoyl-L-alanine amidase n=1 Tax=Fructobacillus papyriferae TaxID=2713171 RepID=A0ABS5QNM7_9LACO|nr:N-acetylmuramoyl-L-alanine amidase [Fructobacillus papyriferae]MBS9334734.1 N-acetylmuramoyl-L-alanine amidase [Fructobacillus papyriferae]MCD2158724.1 N-acetylmuramoyl-L-alanine amidase [Fructobacillus papyriferae]